MISTKYPIYIPTPSQRGASIYFCNGVIRVGKTLSYLWFSRVSVLPYHSPQGNKGDVFTALKVYGSYLKVTTVLLWSYHHSLSNEKSRIKYLYFLFIQISSPLL